MAARIKDETGLEIGKESLRQSIEAVSKKKKHPPSTPQDSDVRAALADFAIKAGYLTEAELDQHRTLGLLPEAFLTFLTGQTDIDTQRFEYFCGSYTCDWVDGSQSESLQLTLDFEGRDRGLSATAVSHTFYSDADPEDGSPLVFQGFLGCDQHGFSVVLLHNETFNENICFLLMQTEPPMRLDAEPSSMAVVLYQGAIGASIDRAKLPSPRSLLLTRTTKDFIANDRKDSDRPKRLGFAATHQNIEGMEALEQLSLDDRFLELCRKRLFGQAAKLIPHVTDINRLHPELQVNALHMAAAMSAPLFIDKLSKRDDLDLLQKDKRGLFAFDIAAIDGLNQELSVELYQLARAKADDASIKLLPPYPG